MSMNACFRTGILDYLESMRLRGQRHGVYRHASCQRQPVLYASCYAALARHLLADLGSLGPEQREEWVDFVGNEVLNLGHLLQYERDCQHVQPAARAVEILLDWLDSPQDPERGLWSIGFETPEQRNAAYEGAYHFFLLHECDGRPILHAERIIDFMLSMQTPQGGFGLHEDTSGCEDIDAIDPLAAAARVDEGRITGVVIEGRGGRSLIACRCAVDASGDADLAAAAGAEFRMVPREALWRMLTNATMQRVRIDAFLDCVGRGVKAHDLNAVIGRAGATLDRDAAVQRMAAGTSVCLFWGELLRAAVAAGAPCPYLAGTQERLRFDTWLAADFNPYYAVRSLDGIVPGPASAVEGMSPVEDLDYSRAVDRMRKGIDSQLQWVRRYLPGFEGAELLSSAPVAFVTESRRIVGHYVLREQDVLESRHFDDCIGRSAGHDRHHEIPRGEHEVPYRCLVPRNLDGLLVAGRCISADREGGWRAFDAIRGQLTGIVTGQAAGTAAALAACQRVAPREVDVAELRRVLAAQGAIV
ncbi:MAG: FAD-dependent oxidoreductase [Candidatus Latescibacterota bacterium]